MVRKLESFILFMIIIGLMIKQALKAYLSLEYIYDEIFMLLFCILFVVSKSDVTDRK